MEILFNAFVVGLMVGVLYLIGSIFIVAGKKGAELGEKGLHKAKKIVEEVQDKSKSDKQKIIEMDEEKFLIAQREIDQENQIESLWVKAKVLSEGNNDLRELEYIKLRVNQLTKEENL